MAIPHSVAKKMKKRSMPDKELTSLIPRNSLGGVLVTEEELRLAFEFLDAEGSGKVTLKNLRARLGVFYSDLKTQDYKLLMNGKRELTLENLRELLLENAVRDIDPVEEAFKAYDPDGEGHINGYTLREFFSRLGYGQLTQEETQLLLDSADLDGDGRVTLSDFRGLTQSLPLSHSNQEREQSGATGES